MLIWLIALSSLRSTDNPDRLLHQSKLLHSEPKWLERNKASSQIEINPKYSSGIRRLTYFKKLFAAVANLQIKLLCHYYWGLCSRHSTCSNPGGVIVFSLASHFGNACLPIDDKAMIIFPFVVHADSRSCGKLHPNVHSYILMSEKIV